MKNSLNKTLKDFHKEKCEIEEHNEREGVDYTFRKSSASCKLSEIVGIIYGGLSSRFWMYRKHMNVQNFGKINSGNAAFYAWQCITIQMRYREVDLVIPDERDMDSLIEVIVDAMSKVKEIKDPSSMMLY